MDSDHQHGASAAQPPKVTPLPETTPATNPPCLNAKAVAPAAVAAKTSDASTMTHSSVVTTTTKVISPTSKISSSIVAMSTCTAKKRPLPTSLSNDENKTPLLVPALKTKFESDKVAPVKAKKTLKKKKKKKFSSILSGMMKPKKVVDLQAERESLRKNLGGGNFCKVDKI